MKEAASKDSLHKFKISKSGFLYAYIKSNSQASYLPIKGEIVRFNYQIEDLDQNVIYSSEEVGSVEYAIDQDDLLTSIKRRFTITSPQGCCGISFSFLHLLWLSR